MKYGRILLTAVSAEILAILSLIVAVFLFGPSDTEGAEAFAKETGIWLGPVAGFVFTLLGSWVAFRKLDSRHLENGIAVGLAVAAIDVLLLVAIGSDFQAVFVFSNVGRIVAGFIGGWMASKSQAAV